MNGRKISLEALEVLDAIERRGSFAAAAESLYRVPSKVTYTVQKLEQDLGVRLFRKEGRRSVLTPAGKLLLEQGRELLEAADRLVENTLQLERGWEPRLRIALDSAVPFEVVAPILGEFCALQPTTDIEIFDEVLGGSWEAITTRRADLAIGAPDEPADRRGLMTAEFQDIEWVFAVAPTHPLASSSQAITAEEQQRHRAVIVRDSSRVGPALSRRVFEKQPRLVVASMQQKIETQVASLGTGFLPRSRITHYLERGDLVELKLVAPVDPTASLLVWREGHQGRALDWFIERLSR